MEFPEEKEILKDNFPLNQLRSCVQCLILIIRVLIYCWIWICFMYDCHVNNIPERWTRSRLRGCQSIMLIRVFPGDIIITNVPDVCFLSRHQIQCDAQILYCSKTTSSAVNPTLWFWFILVLILLNSAYPSSFRRVRLKNLAATWMLRSVEWTQWDRWDGKILLTFVKCWVKVTPQTQV